MRAPSRLRPRISALVVVGALVVAGGVALLLINTVDLRGGAESTTRTDAFLLRVVDTERLVVDAETGLRGAVITGRALFLQPLYRAQSQLPSATAALQQAASENHAYQQQTAALIAAVRSYMSVYIQHGLAMIAHDLPTARSFSTTLQGKRLVDGIRARVTVLEHLVSDSQAARQRAARRTANGSIVEAVVVLVSLTLLTTLLGGYLGHLAVERERARELSEETTRTLQESILPGQVPTIPGCELATRFIPGGGPVSGDFYDILEIKRGEWILIIGDVCGKGAEAAAATAMGRWTLRSSLALGGTPSEALRFLNDVVLRHGQESRFITAACIKLTFEPEVVQVEIACAGHPAPVFVPREGAPARVAAEGDLLGVLPTIRLQTAEVQLRAGDGLVSYTDGVTDQGPELRRSPEQALEDRPPDADAEQLSAILEELARQPVGRHPDDIAIISLRFLGQNLAMPPLAVAARATDEGR